MPLRSLEVLRSGASRGQPRCLNLWDYLLELDQKECTSLPGGGMSAASCASCACAIASGLKLSRSNLGGDVDLALGQAVPTDPTIYRFYEIVQVYGTTLKALIHEEFGDGIMTVDDSSLGRWFGEGCVLEHACSILSGRRGRHS